MPRAAYVTVKKDKNNPQEGIIILETPYNAEFVKELKARSISRSWNGECWTVDACEKSMVVNLIKVFYKDIPAYLIEGAVTTNIHTGEVC